MVTEIFPYTQNTYNDPKDFRPRPDGEERVPVEVARDIAETLGSDDLDPTVTLTDIPEGMTQPEELGEPSQGFWGKGNPGSDTLAAEASPLDPEALIPTLSSLTEVSPVTLPNSSAPSAGSKNSAKTTQTEQIPDMAFGAAK